jgi:hypothetical protein
MGLFDSIGKALGDTFGGVYHKITGTQNESEKRADQYAINDQIKAYKQQSELSNSELQKVQAEKDVQKRKINEKQIRALRSQYRPAGAGFLNNNSSSQLGSDNTTPSKLGV